MNAIARPRRETPDDRLQRQAAYFREIAEMNMHAARVAHDAVEQARSTGQDTAKPILDLSRATRGVVAAVNAENALFRTERAPRAPAGDTRRPLLCNALLRVAKAEPDPAHRGALNRDIPTLVEELLVADPDAETPVDQHLIDLADRLGLVLDPSKLPDELVGMPPGSTSATDEPPGRQRPSRPSGSESSAVQRYDHAARAPALGHAWRVPDDRSANPPFLPAGGGVRRGA